MSNKNSDRNKHQIDFLSAKKLKIVFNELRHRMIRLSILAKITILSIICTIGLSFLLLACILPNSYWPLFIFLFYVFLPIPLFIAISCGQNENTVGLTELAIFITAILFVSTFGLPIVLYLKNYIRTQAFIFTLIGNVIFILTGLVYAFLFHRRQNNSF